MFWFCIVCFKALVFYFTAWKILTFIPVDVLNLCTVFFEPVKKKSFAEMTPLFLPIEATVMCGRNACEGFLHFLKERLGWAYDSFLFPKFI